MMDSVSFQYFKKCVYLNDQELVPSSYQFLMREEETVSETKKTRSFHTGSGTEAGTEFSRTERLESYATKLVKQIFSVDPKH
jgi:hypothetical protein